MSESRQGAESLILAISHWSQRPWETPSLVAGVRSPVGGGEAREPIGLKGATNGLRDVVERSLVRPSPSDIAPRLVGLDVPLYLASLGVGGA